LFKADHGKGQRPSTGIFIYAKPKDQIQINHNKQSQAITGLQQINLFMH
jgi:hypothetical protein